MVFYMIVCGICDFKCVYVMMDLGVVLVYVCMYLLGYGKIYEVELFGGFEVDLDVMIDGFFYFCGMVCVLCVICLCGKMIKSV